MLLTAALYEPSCAILEAFAARKIYIDRRPTIEEGVFDLFVQYEDLQKARDTLTTVLADLEKHTQAVPQPAQEEPKEMSRGKKWLIRFVSAVAFGLLVWGAITLTDFVVALVQGWIS